MKLVRNAGLIRIKSLIAAATLLAASGSPGVASAGLERVGPTRSDVGYPAWYQDSTGVVLEFCSPSPGELATGHCLLLPADTTAPEVFPDQFADEHFYWAADAVGDWTYDGAAGEDVRLILALEAAFSIGPVRDGDQIVFGRLRLRIDDVPLSGTYTVYTPYGKYEFAAVAGDRIFFTEDIGITCQPGDFTCALQSSIGPFLLPSDTPGGAELGPVSGPDPTKRYIADPGRSGPVTGSPLPDWVLSDGSTRNANVFVVEAPDGQVIFETYDFALMGRLFSGEIPGRVTVDRASYSRTQAGQQIDTFVTAFPTRQARMPATPVVEPEPPQLQVFSAPCAGAAPPFAAPPGVPQPLAQNGSVYFAQTRPAVAPTHVCLEHTNARNTSGQIVPAYFNVPLGDKVAIAEATYDPDARTLKVVASSSDLVDLPQLSVGSFGDVQTTDIPVEGVLVIPGVAAPPHEVRVTSAQSGTNTMQVVVTASTGGTNGAPDAVDDTADALASVPLAVDVLANDVDPDGDPLTVVAVTPPAHGTVSFAGGLNVTYTASAGHSGPDAFTYTVSDGNGGFDTANVFVSVHLAANSPPVASPDAATTSFGLPVTLQVLVNDTDPNGDPMAVVGVSQPPNGEGVVTFTASSVTFTPAPGWFGLAAFTYTVADTRGGETPGDVVVTVQAQEIIAFTRAEFRTTAPGQYRIDGTGTVEGSVVTLTLVRGPTTAPIVVGELGAPTVTGGLWTLRLTPGPDLVPQQGDRVTATSSLNTVRTQNLTIRR